MIIINFLFCFFRMMAFASVSVFQQARVMA